MTVVLAERWNNPDVSGGPVSAGSAVSRRLKTVFVRIEYGKISVRGDRKENQDKAKIVVSDNAALLLTFDGMGGHLDGARAADLALTTVEQMFNDARKPVFDPQGFLYMALGRAHDAVVADAEEVAIDDRPRATGAICLVQDKAAYFAHVGDSRVYLLRDGRVSDRTRDHSHVEVLLQEGVIKEHQLKTHPMRNFVESCLGGDDALPSISVSSKKRLRAGDTLIACTDGLWSGLAEKDIARMAAREDMPLIDSLREMVDRAVGANAPYSDNTTATSLRWLG
ncbi:MAG: PP2C family serine/threonine-protein phosphatase [Pseudomonadota bacterium]